MFRKPNWKELKYWCSHCGYETQQETMMIQHKNDCPNFVPNMNYEDTPVQQEINNNPVLKEVQGLLESQTAKGLEKYGNTVSIDEYNLSEWIDHVLQEKMDEIVYLMTIKHKIKKVIG